MDSLEVEVDVNEAYIGRVQPKMPVEAVLNAYPDWKIPAEVIAIIPTADRSKATVKVRIALNVKDPRIVPDMGVRVSFLEAAKPAVANTPTPPGVLVPGTAIVARDGGDVAFVVADDHAKLVHVLAGDIRGEQRVVQSGLAIGDVVIVSPAPELHDGAAILIK
jgi:multidrug efflux pump subunit AcrA (membrane-fusion protein)